MVTNISGEVVVASNTGCLNVLDDDLDIRKKFAGIDNQPESISGNTTFIAVGDSAGVVRFYERHGDKEPKVGKMCNF